MAGASLAEIEAFLGVPGSYDLPEGAPVERIETHISIVFLAGEYAYKLKKPLDLAYLDFTTLEARKQACEQELTLNRRTAPELYLGLVPVILTADGLVLGEDATGNVVDWLVKMKRFDQSALLSQMADRGALTVPLVERLARKVEHFHRSAEVSKTDGGRTRFAEILESNQKNFKPFVGNLYSRALMECLTAGYADALTALADLIDERRERGWVRHCHGDLHLNNVVCLQDEPVPFDCIEFNDAFARIDTLYDLAFLLMDLAFRAREDRSLSAHANAALNAYLQQQSLGSLSQTLKGLEALSFFMSVRAGVRSHVSARMTEKADGGGASLKELAWGYADFARDLLKPTENRLYAIGGLSGTGKTTIARLLAPELGHPVGAVHLRTDIIRKRQAGVADTDRLPSSAYTKAASDQVYAEMARLAGIALDAGQTVICDAVFSKPAERTLLEDMARRKSLPFHGLWLAAPAEELEARVEKRARDDRDASDAGVEVVRQQASYDLGALAWNSVEAGGALEAVLDRTRAALNLTIV